MADHEPESTCPRCGHDRFAEWEVPAGGGLSIKLLPLSFFQGGKLLAQACLRCGHVGWSLEPGTLEWVREWAEKKEA